MSQRSGGSRKAVDQAATIRLVLDQTMKKRVSAYEAKTHLPSLVAEAEQGTRITITRHGVAVAELGPIGRPPDVEAAIEGLMRLRKGRTLGKISLRRLIEEGRR